MKLTREEIFEYHKDGKVGTGLTSPFKSIKDLCLAYTPGVAQAVLEIADKPKTVFDYTAKKNLVGVVTDGTAILGLGDRGASASIPVMEGKAVLFKAFGDVDGWPIPLNCVRKDGKNEGPTDPQRIIDAVCAIAPMYGGINLEDIAAPACFEIEDTLDAMLDIPVFHDDQWGTAVITLAAVMNYCVLSGKKLEAIKIIVNGAGSAGIRIAQMIKAAGATNVTMCDSKGPLSTSRELTGKKLEMAVDTDATTMEEALVKADIFIGVSAANCLKKEAVETMADYPAIMAMANPDPEIDPADVRAVLGDKPYVMATGRSDYPNQVNNVLGFPYLFRGALDSKATTINMEMKVAAAKALAELAREEVPQYVKDLYNEPEMTFGNQYILPKPFDPRLFEVVPYAVAMAAEQTGAARVPLTNYKAELAERNKERMKIFE
jgi:malate dehydrogenase (oxaloacetate-decarboxylating)(NADP+)